MDMNTDNSTCTEEEQWTGHAHLQGIKPNTTSDKSKRGTCTAKSGRETRHEKQNQVNGEKESTKQ